MFSIIVCSINPARFAAVKAMYTAAMGDEPWELIGIHDARSLAEGYNRGFAASRGEIIIFSHDDVEVLNPGLPGRLRGHLKKNDLLGVAGTTKLIHSAWVWAAYPHIYGQVACPLEDGKIRVNIWAVPAPVVESIQAIDGVFMAARRSLLDRVRFDAATFDGFHHYDLDFSYGAHRAGFKVCVANDIGLLHISQGAFGETWAQSAKRFNEKWFPGTAITPFPTFSIGCIEVENRAKAMEVMSPPHWTQKSDGR
jgi:hypothetical protein